MKILIDKAETSDTSHFSSDKDTFSVDSSKIKVLSCDADDRAQVRAEYLYKVCVDHNTHVAMVEDVDVANNLSELGIDTTHII